MSIMIYLDNSATTPLLPESRSAVLDALMQFGNPSSLHALGFAAHENLENCRKVILDSLWPKGTPRGRIIFTGSGTEANNLALLGCARAKARRAGSAILSSDAEHPAVENTLAQLEKEGFRIFRIPTKGGSLDLGFAEKILRGEDVSLISLMLVNNETGAFFEVEKVFALAKQLNPEILTHCDAVQGYMKVPCCPESLHADLMTLSSHKIHGPKGVGALYVGEDVLKRKDLVPVIYGGGQEQGFRSGTENVPGIAGFAAAASVMVRTFDERHEKVCRLRKRLTEGLADSEAILNEPLRCAPHIVSLTVPGIRSETLVHFFSGKGICVSSGSACSSRSGKPSRALTAHGLSQTDADSTVRISLSFMNTDSDIDTFLEALREAETTLVRKKPGRRIQKKDGPGALIAMSGGVDSSVAAYLMKKAGYRCMGTTMRLYSNEEIGFGGESTCCSKKDIDDAEQVAIRLGIPYEVLDYTEDFKREIIEKFIRVYEAGGTPNPCIDCNRTMKFDKLLQFARSKGFDCIVTGHYARVEKENGRFILKKALDLSKDQSYVLYTLTQEQLEKLILPLGNMSKSDVRILAEEQGFVNASKHDSQDICFVPDGDYVRFMEHFTGKTYPDGSFLDTKGNVIGRHHGAVRYTIGQRKGLGIALGEPSYVIDKDMARNTVTVGREEELFSRTLFVDDLNWISVPSLEKEMRVKAKTRYRQSEQWATLYPEPDGRVKVVFDEAQRAVTVGQAAVFYDGDTVVGGGTICETERLN